MHKIYSHIYKIQNVTFGEEMTMLWSWCKQTSIQGNEMAERTLGTNRRNNPGDVKEKNGRNNHGDRKGRITRVTLF
jgi:hypothetical protein